jgi:hypothetical protein
MQTKTKEMVRRSGHEGKRGYRILPHKGNFRSGAAEDSILLGSDTAALGN